MTGLDALDPVTRMVIAAGVPPLEKFGRSLNWTYESSRRAMIDPVAVEIVRARIEQRRLVQSAQGAMVVVAVLAYILGRRTR